MDEKINLKPGRSIVRNLDYDSPDRLTIRVTSVGGYNTLEYKEHISSGEPTPDPAEAPTLPAETTSIDELYYIGQHLEQYHHATRNAEDYYLDGLKRDPLHYNCNVAMAHRAFEAADFKSALYYADQALKRAHKYNKNPVCGKASYIRGCTHEKLGNLDEAYRDLYKSTWSGNCVMLGMQVPPALHSGSNAYKMHLIVPGMRYDSTA